MVKLKNIMKICLIGINLTSLILAEILSRKKIFIDIYSKKQAFKKYKTRSLGISEDNVRFLSILYPKIKKKFYLINKINVLIKNQKLDEKVSFNKGSSPLFYISKFDTLFTYVKKKVQKSNLVKFKKFNKKLREDTLYNNKKYSLFINCSNSSFFTKKFLKKGINKNYNNIAFTTIFKHKKINNNMATQVFTSDGPIAYLPISNNSTSVVFSYEIKKNQYDLEKYAIKEIIKNNPFYKILSFSNVEKFNLKLRISKNYYHKNILFFGDNLHSIHPLAGQGFNMTIRDIKSLNEIIDKKINLGLPIDSKVLEEFENKTKSLNSLFSLGIDFVYEFFRFNKKFFPTKMSKKLFSFINKNEKIKNIGISIANKGLNI